MAYKINWSVFDKRDPVANTSQIKNGQTSVSCLPANGTLSIRVINKVVKSIDFHVAVVNLVSPK